MSQNNLGCTDTIPCITPDCGCKVLLGTDCTTLTEDLTCSNILEGQTLTEALRQLDTYICERFTSVENFIKLVNIGAGAKIYKGISSVGKKELRTLLGSSFINIEEGEDTVTILIDEAVLEEIINAAAVTQVQTDWDATTGLGVLLNKPLITVPAIVSEDEGNGLGFIVKDRVSTNYGPIGFNAIDLSYSGSPSSTLGATGRYAAAFGVSNTSSGYGSASMGTDNISSGQYSFTTGGYNVASDDGTIAMGGGNTASRSYAIALGSNNISSGLYAVSLGYTNFSRSFGEVAVGLWGTDYTPLAVIGWNGLDRIFNVGNGENSVAKSNALTILKNGLATLPSVTTALIGAASGKAIVTKEYLTSVLPATADGSETKINPGTNVSITGTGTLGSPYVVNSSFTDTNTTYSAGYGVTLSGTTFSIENLQKVLVYPTDFVGTNYTLTSADDNYEIIVDNGATAVTFTIPTGLVAKIGVGFTQKGTGDVSYIASGTNINNPTGLKIKGQFHQTYLSQEGSTNVFYLGGNTKL